MQIGTYYYPEQWPSEQWIRDFDNMAAMGLQIVHMGEFAWFEMEPEEGKIRLDWLAECVEMAAARKMSVILCTPTAVPPIWLVKQHPTICIKQDNGQPQRHGGRRHGSPTSPEYIEASKKIVQALADRFGNHPSVIGWQIDNELSSLCFDQNEHSHVAFQNWLQGKYGEIAKLNEAWGCQFWNTYYTSFDQIQLPASRTLAYDNPHQRVDASRFWSQAMASYAHVQAEILRPKIGKRFITTNFMPMHLDCNPADMANDLDLMSWDSYPVTGWGKALKDETFRIARPNPICLMHDQMASYHKRWALLEVQVGQTNWSGTPVLLYPGAVRLWLWTAFAHGAEFITTYRYRQPRFGVELFHHGLMGSDGVTQSPGGRQFVQTIEEIKRLSLDKIPSLAEDKDQSHTVGLVMDFDQLWQYTTMPQAVRWNYAEQLASWYGAIVRQGLRVRVLRPDEDWSGLAMVVAPALQMLDEALVKKMTDYAAKGGHLLLTARTGLMNRQGQLWEGPTAMPILPLIGANIEAYDALPEETFGKVTMDDGSYKWNTWADLLYGEEHTRVLAKYADQFYEGAVAITQNHYENGYVTYCGVVADQALNDALLKKLADQAHYKTQVMPEHVHLIRRGPYNILLNYQDKPIEAPAPRGARFVVGMRTVDPAGVAVWE